jgi:hypothetical protein
MVIPRPPVPEFCDQVSGSEAKVPLFVCRMPLAGRISGLEPRTDLDTRSDCGDVITAPEVTCGPWLNSFGPRNCLSAGVLE